MKRRRGIRSAAVVSPLLGAPHGDQLLISARTADVGASRESSRRRRLASLLAIVGPLVGYLTWAWVTGRHRLLVPHVDQVTLFLIVMIIVLPAAMIVPYLGAGRSPHVIYQPEQIGVRLADVKGIAPVKEEVVRSLNLFLAHKTFAREMGGTPRRGLLFEGAPGTGKTFLAKAMAAEAGVPFVFVSATSFQSMFYGATARKIRSYFKKLRKVARREGGVIGFIEEIDAIATARHGLAATPRSEMSGGVGPGLHGCGMSAFPSLSTAPATVVSPYMSESAGGVVNELLVQMQSFALPMGWQRLRGKVVDFVNLFLPSHRQLRKPVPGEPNILLIAATNRADNLDPALLRPGRFDRRLTFELPDKRGRRELVDHYLAKKSHHPELDDEDRRDALAGVTQGYTPVMIEHLFDEALVNALRRQDSKMSWPDLERARLTEEVGLGQPVGYTEHEKLLIATHEAGHATMAYLVAPHRRLEVLTIVKRRQALGLLAHGDPDEVYTRSRAEMTALVQVAMGGQCAEELFFGDVSTGPAGDLLYATNTAAEMIGAAGMEGTLTSYAAVANSGLSGTNLVGRVLADAEGRARVEKFLQEQKQAALRLLAANRHLVEGLRDALVDRDELIGREITDVLEAAEAAGPRAEVIDLTEVQQQKT